MSTYFDDFESYSTGSLPTGWTARINADDTWTVETTGSDKYLQLYDPDSNQYLSINSVDSDADRQDAEVLLKWRRNSVSANKAFAFVRLTGNSSAFSGYRIGGSSSTLQAYRAVSATSWTSIASSSATTSADTDYWVRFRVNGTAIQVRMWADGGSEPGTWDIDTTDSNVSGDGWVGVGAITANSAVYTYWQVGIGTNGDTAPDSGSTSATSFLACRAFPLSILNH